MSTVVVIGGGISGMACAYMIQEKARQAGQTHNISVLESDKRLGGKIRTEIVDGFVCESGPLGFIDNKPPVLRMVNQLEMAPDLVVSNDSARKRYVLIDGKLQLLPMSPPGFIKTKMISWPGKLRALWELRTKPADPSKDETIAEFARRHLGAEIVDKLVSAMVVGIFAGDAEQLSVKSCFPVMLELEKEGSGSLLKAQMRRSKAKKAKAKVEGAEVKKEGPKSEGMVGSSGKLTTFQAGMSQVVDRLKDKFTGDIITGAEVVGLSKEDGRYQIERANGERLEADIVVMAVPAYVAAKILKNLAGDAAELIDGIQYVPVNVIVSGYDKAGFGHDLDGFGFLAPKREKRGILGNLWNSSIFEGQAPTGKVALRTMVGGAINPDATALSDKETLDLVQKELHEILGVSSDPTFTQVIRHKRAIPQYVVGHEERINKIAGIIENYPGLVLTGNAFRGVGFNDCVINAGKVADQIVNSFK